MHVPRLGRRQRHIPTEANSAAAGAGAAVAVAVVSTTAEAKAARRSRVAAIEAIPASARSQRCSSAGAETAVTAEETAGTAQASKAVKELIDDVIVDDALVTNVVDVCSGSLVVYRRRRRSQGRRISVNIKNSSTDGAGEHCRMGAPCRDGKRPAQRRCCEVHEAPREAPCQRRTPLRHLVCSTAALPRR